MLTSTLDTDRVIELARRIHRSQRILVVGVDLAASLAWFLAYGLRPVGLDADAPVGSAGNLQHKIDLLTGKDLLIAISFGRCLRETMHAVLRAKSRGVPTFGITDGSTTPIAMHCDAHLLAPIGSPSFTGSHVAPMALINAITLACTHLQPKRALAILRHTERTTDPASAGIRNRYGLVPAPMARASESGDLNVTNRKTHSIALAILAMLALGDRAGARHAIAAPARRQPRAGRVRDGGDLWTVPAAADRRGG